MTPEATDTEQAGLSAEMLAEAASEGIDVADGYRVTTMVPYTDSPEANTYDIPPQDLDEFFCSYAETAEVVIDIRVAVDREVIRDDKRIEDGIAAPDELLGIDAAGIDGVEAVGRLP